MLDTLQKLQRQAHLTSIIGRLIILATEDIREFDGLLNRIEQRIDFYENNLPMISTNKDTNR